jgi:hypothetical protein
MRRRLPVENADHCRIDNKLGAIARLRPDRTDVGTPLARGYVRQKVTRREPPS